MRAVGGSDKLRRLRSASRQAKATGQGQLRNNATVGTRPVIAVGKPRRVRESFAEKGFC